MAPPKAKNFVRDRIDGPDAINNWIKEAVPSVGEQKTKLQTKQQPKRTRTK
jgi:hypothetical protein